MKNDESPASDGYTSAFFKFFFEDLGSFIFCSINCGFSNGEMSVTQRQGIINCIHKEGKVKTFLKNWRPTISLNICSQVHFYCLLLSLQFSLLLKQIEECYNVI